MGGLMCLQPPLPLWDPLGKVTSVHRLMAMVANELSE